MKAKRLHSQALQLRQRFNGRLFFVVFIVMMVATVITVSRQTRLYEARGELEIPRPAVMAVESVVDASMHCGIDMNTVREVMVSQTMLVWVIGRLTAEDRSAFFRPYGHADHSDAEIARLISTNRTLRIVPKILRLEMRYRHPDRHMAARIVDLFLTEAVAYEARVSMDQDDYAFRYLQERVEQSMRQLEVSEHAVITYRESRPELKDAELVKDEKYQALVKKAESETNLHKQILARLSEMQASNKNEASGWRISQPPITPAEDDYLLEPLIVTAAWGSLIAFITAALAAVLFQRRPISANQPEGL